MANVIRLKRASGSDPAASDLVSGEPAVRTDTGELFFKKDDGSVAKVSGAGGGPDFKYLALRNAANNGAASYPNADFTLVTSGTTNALTPTAANTLLVSVNGVIQKPNTGTSTPSQGFALSGSTIKFGANISAAPDFILYQESGGIGEPSDETVSEAKLKVSNSPVNGYFLSAQSGNNGGLTWAAPVATSCTGNSATATALATARTINGTSFDGTANITVTAAAGTLTGNTLNSSVTASSLTSLGDLSGLTVTGNLAVDTNTLFVNASTNRVGMGTTSPTTDFDVIRTNSSLTDVMLVKGNVGNGFIRFQDNDSSCNFTLGADDGSGTGVNSFILYDRVNSAYRWSIDNSGNMKVWSGNVEVSTGKVGIGTSSPDAPLTIHNSSDPEIRFGYNASQDHRLAWDSSKVRLSADPDDANNASALLLDVDGLTRIYINDSGDIGIGTTNPQRRLHVDGGNVTNSVEIHGTGSHELYSYHDSQGVGWATGSGGSFGELFYLNESSSEARIYTGGTERLRLSATEVVVNEPSANTDFRVEGDTNSHLLFVDAGNDRVGIGTSSPAYTLDVNGSIAARVANSTSYQTGFNVTNSITTDLQVWVKNNAVAIGPSTATNIHFVTQGNGNTRMIVQDNGSVGIGTTSPSTKLHVNGTVTATSFAGDGSNLTGVDAGFPSGTVMLFQQTNAPTGWTKLTSHNNKALRLVSGSPGTGGSNTFTTAFNSSRSTSGGSVSNHTLTTSQIPSHNHTGGAKGIHDAANGEYGTSSQGSVGFPLARYPGSANYDLYTTSSTGGGSGHNHGFSNPSLNLNVQYVDVIMASKD